MVLGIGSRADLSDVKIFENLWWTMTIGYPLKNHHTKGRESVSMPNGWILPIAIFLWMVMELFSSVNAICEASVPGPAQKLEQMGYGWVVERLGALRKEAIRIMTTPQAEMAFALGASKIGGLPHLPPGFEWPRFQERPLLFLAQIDLSELPAGEAADLLPERGILYFFYEGIESGFRPEDRDAAMIFYYQGDAALLERRGMREADESFTFDRPCALSYRTVVEYPTSREAIGTDELLKALPEDGKRTQVIDLVDEFLQEVADVEDWARHKLLGWPDLIQGSIFWEAQLASNGVSFGPPEGYEISNADGPTAIYLTSRFSIIDKLLEFFLGEPDIIRDGNIMEVQSEGLHEAPPVMTPPAPGNFMRYDDEKVAELEPGIRDWILLFQLDTDAAADMMWGDVGTVYFTIKKDDLAARRFENAWFSMQCH